jgi:hypothetical protein
MYTMAAYLAGKISVVKEYHLLLERIEHWFHDDKNFVQEVVKHMLQIHKQESYKDSVLGTDEIIKWVKQKFGDEIDLTV